MPSFEKASNVAAEQAELQAFLNELLTLYLRDVLSFVNTNYDLFIRHLRALGRDDPQASAKEVFHALRAVAGVPVPEHGSEPPVRYDLGPLQVIALDESTEAITNGKSTWEEDDPFSSGENVPAAVEKSWRAYQLSRRALSRNIK